MAFPGLVIYLQWKAHRQLRMQIKTQVSRLAYSQVTIENYTHNRQLTFHSLFNFMVTTTDNALPYPDDATNLIYELMFCDRPDLFRSKNNETLAYPWDVLFATPPDIDGLYDITMDGEAESRVKLLAYNAIRNSGEPIEDKELLGVIVEVGMEDGLDALASYKDGTGRYINYTGKMIISDAPDEVLKDITAQLFRDSMIIVGRIGPWDGARKPHPVKGNLRITFLVSDGLYFGEGPINVLFSDAMAAPALQSATALMNYVTNRVLIKK